MSKGPVHNPLSGSTRSFMESRFETDFSNVGIHTGGEAARMNRELGARAFAHDGDIYFGFGQHNPQSVRGKRLLAHELTHVVQQQGNPGRSIVMRQFDWTELEPACARQRSAYNTATGRRYYPCL